MGRTQEETPENIAARRPEADGEREREGRTKTIYTEKLTRGLETGEVREEGKEDR